MVDNKENELNDEMYEAMPWLARQYPDWEEYSEDEKREILDSEIYASRIDIHSSIEYAYPQYKVHRIVLEDILIDPDNPPEGEVDRSLSIPLSGDIRSVWAPNGYGKTFAFKILKLLASNSTDSVNSNELYLYFNDFFMRCAKEISSEKKITNLIPSDFISPSAQKKLIPFSRINVRLVESNNNEVVDISVSPNWNPEHSDESMVKEILRKFWNPLSLESPFLKKNPDPDLEEIFGLNSSSNSSPIIEPNFLLSSFNRGPDRSFILPQTMLRFYEMIEDEEYPDQPYSSDSKFTIELRDKIATEIEVLISRILHRGKDKKTLIEQDEIGTLNKIDDFLSSTKNTYRWDNIEEEINNGEELLFELLELSIKYKNLVISKDSELMEMIDGSNGIEILINPNPTHQDTLFDYLFVLFDYYLHDFNALNSNFGEYKPFDEMTEDDWNDYESKKFNTSMIYSMPWRLFPSNSENPDFTLRELDVLEGDEYYPCFEMVWEESCFANALKNLHLRYFEIPNIINYSSDKKLKRSQDDMNELLRLFRNNYNSLKSEMSDDGFLYTDSLSDTDYDNLYQVLSYIKDTLGGRDDTLDSFLSPLTGFEAWGLLFTNLSHPPMKNESRFPYMFPNLVNPVFSKILEQILGFVEIIDNINASLNSEEAESWAASCRFNDWDLPMKFSDPKIGYDIQPRHLSFGQCSVVALEVCIGAGLLVPQIFDEGEKFMPRPIQSCIILDEPEIGRSEHWVNKISERIFDLLDEIKKPLSGNIFDQSFTIVSHRESLLRSLSSTNNYYVMQPVSPRDPFSNDKGEEK